MAYISKEQVKAKSIALKAINKKYNVKATFSGSNSSTLQLTISSGSLDFIDNYLMNLKPSGINTQEYLDQHLIPQVLKDQYLQINHYYLSDWFSSSPLMYLEEVKELMLEGWWDKSDLQTDYFNCAFYIRMQVGRWDKGYALTI